MSKLFFTVKASETDKRHGFLLDKLIAGAGIAMAKLGAGDDEKVQFSLDVGGPLDAMSVKPLAAWWTKRLRRGAEAFGAANNAHNSLAPIFFNIDGSFPSPAALAALSLTFDVGVQRLYDQIRGNDLSPKTAFPKLFTGSTQLPVLEGAAQVMDFANVANQFFERSDVLGLGTDPALTLAWKMRLKAPFSGTTFPSLLSLGTAATPEMSLFFTQLSGHDRIEISDASDAHFVAWHMPLNTLLDYHSFVLTKPAGSGMFSDTWKFYLDGVDQGSPTNHTSGGSALGATLTRVGDFGAAAGAAGGFPFVGTLAGIMVFGAVLGAADLALLNTFLAAV